MAKTKWDKKTIIDSIRTLHKNGEDLTCKRVKEIDSALVGAAISYFSNWGNAIRAAGFDYFEIQKMSRKRRSESVRKWTVEKVLNDIREVAKTEEDLSCAYMREKYSTLVAAAGNYIGSWKKALEMLGYDYAEVLKKGRKKKNTREKEWYQNLLLERLSKKKSLDEKYLMENETLFHEKLIQHFGSWRKTVMALKKFRAGKES